jgi:hypothetical protein
MSKGLPVSRGLVFFLNTGEIVVDWGDGRVQDIMTGEFMPFEERNYGGAITDSDLELLKKNGRVVSFDSRTVYLGPLPEPPRSTLE